jgi:acetyl-CoA synthetase
VELLRRGRALISVHPVSNSVAWRPTAEIIAKSNLTRFMSSYGVANLEELHRKAVDEPDWFWNAVISDLGISFYTGYSKVLDASAGMPWTRWCVGGSLNIIHNCIDKRARDTRPAIKWEGEDASVRALTYAQLATEVNRTANGLRQLGVRKGHVIAIVMPMLPETAIALFAVAKIGAIILPLFSGYGAEAIRTRLEDAGAVCVITCDGYVRRGRAIHLKSVVDDAVDRSRSVRHVVVVKRSGVDVSWRMNRDVKWSDLAEGASPECDSERTSAEDPLMIIYTSGTTGRPKGTVHTHCGFPIKAAQDLSHAFDVKADDTIFWVTDLGWMMGPWELFGATIIGASVALYEGAVDYPTSQRLWDVVQRHGVSVLGVSPTLVRMLMRSGEPQLDREHSTLRILGSTGEPWDEKSWWWFFESVGQSRLPIINYAGGTEISGGILGGNVISPLKPCAFAGPLPGMAADVVDAAGQSLINQVGELAIRRPWIGMSRGFWKDPQRYLDTYWSRVENLWFHGDWACVDHEGSWYILGRSDDTIKVAGKRVGPAEIESVLTQHPQIAEAAVVGIPDDVKGQALVCICVRAGDTPAPRDVLRDLVIRAFGRALRPTLIEYVEELPKTRNGKVMRRVIRAAFLAQEAGDLTALDNPDAVAAIRSLGIAYRAALVRSGDPR